MSRNNNFTAGYERMGQPPRPDEGNVGAALFKSVDWAAARALGSKRDTPEVADEKKPANMEAIKGKTPDTKALANMHAAMGKDIYGTGGQHNPEGVARADALIDRAGRKEDPGKAAAAAHHADASKVAAADTQKHHEVVNPHAAAVPHHQRKTG